MGYYRQKRARHRVESIRAVTHRVTRYTLKELRGWGFTQTKFHDAFRAKRQHAAVILRKWRASQRTKTSPQEAR